MAKPLPLYGYPDGIEIIPARSTTESTPATVIDMGDRTALRTYIAYSGTVSTYAIRLWFHLNGVWYRGPSTADGDPLTGQNEARDWETGGRVLIGFTIDTISGGGTMAVSAETIP